MIGPIRPGPVSDAIPNSKPLANATFIIENEKGPVASFTTDEQGRFQVSLNPGHYTVTRKGAKGGIGRYGPFDVDVVASKMKKVEWQCDTGLR
jgi:Prealbumin-like fold domain